MRTTTPTWCLGELQEGTESFLVRFASNDRDWPFWVDVAVRSFYSTSHMETSAHPCKLGINAGAITGRVEPVC